MLCLHDPIHDDDPAVQRLLSAVEDTHSLTALILVARQVAGVLTIYLVAAVLAERSQHPARWPRCPPHTAGLGDSETLKPRLWLAAVRQGRSTAPQVGWLSEGARGLWWLYEEQLAAVAVGILDFYHAVQYRWKGAAAWLDGRPTRARRWFGWARHRLRHGQPDGVLADLVEAVAVEGLPDSARDTLTAL